MDQQISPQNFEVKEIEKEKSFSFSEEPQKGKMQGLINLFSKKNLPRTLIVVFCAAIVIAGISFFAGRSSFSLENIKITARVLGPVASGEEVVLRVDYFNENRVSLKNAYLILDYPSGTFSSDGKELVHDRRDLGEISKKSQGTEEFKLRFVGEKGDSKSVTVRMEFMPQNINSYFEQSTVYRMEINSVLISLNIDGPEKSISGQEVSYLIEYENKTDKDLYDLQLEVEYDKDFKFKTAIPGPSEEKNNLWKIDVLRKGEKRGVNIVGVLKGKEGESKMLKAAMGRVENEQLIQYSKFEYLTLISSAPILVNVSIQNVPEDCKVYPGQVLNYRIDFKNNTEVPLIELILKAKLEDSVFDLRGIKLGNVGFFDSREKTITWSGGDISALKLLEPNQSGSVEFLVPIKKPVPMAYYDDKNLRANVSAEIETKIIPKQFALSELRISNDLSCKIISEADLVTKVFYYESSGSLSNYGPIPPRVDAKTTFTVHWLIFSGSNDLEGARVYSVLPQGVNWENVYVNSVRDSEVFYNERTKEIVWEIKKIPAGTGRLFSPYELIFQISIIPSINQIETTPVLINEAILEAKDIFTEIILKDRTPEVTTSLPDDKGVSNGRVRM